MSSQVSVARFKYGPWSDDEAEDFWDEAVEDAADNRLGILWQLQFNVGHEHEGSVTIYFSSSPANQNENLRRQTASVTRDLVNGVLIVDAVIQFPRKEGHFHIPKSPMVQNIFQLLDDEEDKDVFFKADDDENMVFSAHKLILKANAPLVGKLLRIR